MALDRYYPFINLTIPDATPPDDPVSRDVQVGDVLLYVVSIRFPAGTGVNSGVQLWLGGAELIPWQSPDTWIGPDVTTPVFRVGTEVDTDLVVMGYNQTGADVAVQLRLETLPIVLLTPPPELDVPELVLASGW